MSLGFDKDHQVVIDAINIAHKQDRPVFFFAAASNDGKNKRAGLAFPARRDYVFGVNATNSHGTALADFNPEVQPSDLCTLGVAVPSAWPFSSDHDGTRVMSGTSMATPIMAASAALAIHFVRQQAIDRPISPHPPEKFWVWLASWIKQKEGMTTLLTHMSARPTFSNPWHYVAPWLLLDGGRQADPELARYQIAGTLYNAFHANYHAGDVPDGAMNPDAEEADESLPIPQYRPWRPNLRHDSPPDSTSKLWWMLIPLMVVCYGLWLFGNQSQETGLSIVKWGGLSVQGK